MQILRPKMSSFFQETIEDGLAYYNRLNVSQL